MVEPVIWLLATLIGTSVILCFVARFGSSFAIGLYVGALATAIIVAGKLGVVHLFGRDITLSASVFVFSATFLITDVIAELFGKEAAERVNEFETVPDCI